MLLSKFVMFFFGKMTSKIYQVEGHFYNGNISFSCMPTREVINYNIIRQKEYFHLRFFFLFSKNNWGKSQHVHFQDCNNHFYRSQYIAHKQL